MIIKKEQLNKIYDLNDDGLYLVEFLTNYDGKKIEISEKISEDEKIKLSALNKTCLEIIEIISTKDIKLSKFDILEIIKKRKILKNEYPFSNNQEEVINEKEKFKK